ncbi:MAG: DUF6036 family nucleotidyltransferase [Prosthecobacter sp.]
MSAIAPEVRIIVFGSSSALCSHPELPEVTDSYQQTLDADFIIDPWDNALAQMLSDTLGKESGFFEHFKYYADIVRPAAFDNFPPDFRERLVPLEGCPRVFALDPHDMAVAKLFAGRPKDIRLLSFLLATGRLNEDKVRKLLWDTPMEEKWIVRTHAVLDQVVAEAAKQRAV